MILEEPSGNRNGRSRRVHPTAGSSPTSRRSVSADLAMMASQFAATVGCSQHDGRIVLPSPVAAGALRVHLLRRRHVVGHRRTTGPSACSASRGSRRPPGDAAGAVSGSARLPGVRLAATTPARSGEIECKRRWPQPEVRDGDGIVSTTSALRGWRPRSSISRRRDGRRRNWLYAGGGGSSGEPAAVLALPAGGRETPSRRHALTINHGAVVPSVGDTP